jgi:ABC-type branched-subunit amino acid transport system substrate-binding protein
LNRRKFFSVALVAAFATLSITGALAHGNPIRSGLLAPLTGATASAGRELVDDWDLYWNQVGRTIANRKVEVTIEDDGVQTLRAEGLSTLLVEQNLHSALSVADTVHIIEAGSIVYTGLPAGLTANKELMHRHLGG